MELEVAPCRMGLNLQLVLEVLDVIVDDVRVEEGGEQTRVGRGRRLGPFRARLLWELGPRAGAGLTLQGLEVEEVDALAGVRWLV